MSGLPLTYLACFLLALPVAFFVYLDAPNIWPSRLFLALGIALGVGFLVEGNHLQQGASSTLAGVSTGFALTGVGLLPLFFIGLFDSDKLFKSSASRAVYHKGYLSFGMLLTLSGMLMRRPFEIGVAAGSVGAYAAPIVTLIGLFLLGRGAMHFAAFQISPKRVAGQIVAGMREGLFLVTRNLTIAWCNPAAESLTKKDGDELCDKPLRSVLTRRRGDGPEITAGWLASSPPDAVIEDIYGELIPVSVDASPLRDSQGTVLGYVIIVRNNEARERRLEEIRQHREQLEELVDLKTRELNDSHNSLKKSKAQLSYLNKILMDVKEQEGMHITRELNNKIVPALEKIVWQARRFTSMAAPDLNDYEYGLGKSEKVVSLANAAIQSVARISAGLPPPDLESGDLVSAVKVLIEEFKKRTGISCRFTLEGTTRIDRVKEEMSIVVYRIVQESLTNAARHAGGDHIDITLGRVGGDIRVTVTDNGRGMTTEQLGVIASTGIRGMKERARSVGGNLEITSEPGTGTTVSFLGAL